MNPAAKSSLTQGVSLRRELGRWGLLALTVNCVVGAGILGLPGKVYALAGDMTIFIVLGAAMLATATALCLAELGSRFDGTGGPIEYCGAAFGRPAGFAAGWLMWTATVLGAAALLNLVASLLAPAHRFETVLTVGIGMTVLAMTGIKQSAAASSALALLKLGLFAGFVIVGLSSAPMPALPPTAPPRLADALMLLFFAFVGFERPTAVAGEVVDARRALPFALVIGMAIVTVLYIGIFIACLRGIPDLASSDQPVRAMAARLFGPTVSGALGWVAGLIVLGTMTTQWITAPRLLLALANDGQMPTALAKISARRRTPDVAIVLTGATAVILALTGDFVATVAASSGTRLIVFIGCTAALLRLRQRSNVPRAQFHLPAGRLLAIAVIAASSLLLLAAAAELVRVAAILLFGVLLWVITKRFQRA